MSLSEEGSESSSSTTEEEVVRPAPSKVAEEVKEEKKTEPADEKVVPSASKLDQAEGGKDAEPLVPSRVQEALNKAGSFEEYRRERVFRYLHLYSGPEDVLGRQLKEEAKKNGIQVMALSLDRKKDKSLDLADPENHEMIKKEVVDGLWDGSHIGFPCNSFSRARHNYMEGMSPSCEGCSSHLRATVKREEGPRGGR